MFEADLDDGSTICFNQIHLTEIITVFSLLYEYGIPKDETRETNYLSRIYDYSNFQDSKTE